MNAENIALAFLWMEIKLTMPIAEVQQRKLKNLFTLQTSHKKNQDTVSNI